MDKKATPNTTPTTPSAPNAPTLQEQLQEAILNDSGIIEQVKLSLVAIAEVYNAFLHLQDGFSSELEAITQAKLEFSEQAKALQALYDDFLAQKQALQEQLQEALEALERKLTEVSTDAQEVQNVLSQVQAIQGEIASAIASLTNLETLKNDIQALCDQAQDVATLLSQSQEAFEQNLNNLAQAKITEVQAAFEQIAQNVQESIMNALENQDEILALLANANDLITQIQTAKQNALQALTEKKDALYTALQEELHNYSQTLQTTTQEALEAHQNTLENELDTHAQGLEDSLEALANQKRDELLSIKIEQDQTAAQEDTTTQVYALALLNTLRAAYSNLTGKLEREQTKRAKFGHYALFLRQSLPQGYKRAGSLLKITKYFSAYYFLGNLLATKNAPRGYFWLPFNTAGYTKGTKNIALVGQINAQGLPNITSNALTIKTTGNGYRTSRSFNDSGGTSRGVGDVWEWTQALSLTSTGDLNASRSSSIYGASDSVEVEAMLLLQGFFVGDATTISPSAKRSAQALLAAIKAPSEALPPIGTSSEGTEGTEGTEPSEPSEPSEGTAPSAEAQTAYSTLNGSVFTNADAAGLTKLATLVADGTIEAMRGILGTFYNLTTGDVYKEGELYYNPTSYYNIQTELDRMLSESGTSLRLVIAQTITAGVQIQIYELYANLDRFLVYKEYFTTLYKALVEDKVSFESIVS